MAQLCLVHGQEHIRGPIFLRILIMPPEMDMMVVLFHDVYFTYFPCFVAETAKSQLNHVIILKSLGFWTASTTAAHEVMLQSSRPKETIQSELEVLWLSAQGYDHVIMIMSSIAPSHWCPFWASQFGQISELPTFEIWYGQNMSKASNMAHRATATAATVTPGLLAGRERSVHNLALCYLPWLSLVEIQLEGAVRIYANLWVCIFPTLAQEATKSFASRW